MKEIFLIIVFAFCLFSCGKTDAEIVSAHEWKHGGGNPVLGDWLTGNTLKISGDTIYKGERKARIVNVEYNIDHYSLEVISVTNNQKGIYIEKGDVE
jgi:hypothetical protein